MIRSTCVGLALLAIGAGPAVAQSSSSAPHTGGFSPFRANNLTGSEFDAVTLVQEECPLDVAVASAGRDERGVVVTVKVTNTGAGAASRHAFTVWAFAPDGTLRGSQQVRSAKPLAAAESRHVDVTLRTVPVRPGDRLVVAMQDVAGDDPWRKDGRTLEAEVRTAVLPPK